MRPSATSASRFPPPWFNQYITFLNVVVNVQHGSNALGLWIPAQGGALSAPRLSSKLTAQACVRAAESLGHMAVILRRGDPDAGVLFVKALARDGSAALFGQTIDMSGAPAWRAVMPGPTPEAEIDDRLAREARIDPDIWIVEVLDDALRHPLNPELV